MQNLISLFSRCLSIVFALMLIVFSSAQAQTVPIVLSDSSNSIELGSNYQLLIDAEHNLTIQDILSNKLQQQFKPLPNGRYNLGYKPETHWFKININNQSKQSIHRLLELHFPLLDDINLYITDSSNSSILSQFGVGDLIPFEQRAYQHPNFIFPIDFPAQKNVSLYFRIKTQGSMTAGSTLWEAETFQAESRKEHFYINLYLGLLIALASYNLFLFISIRERSYLWYVLFAGSMLLAIGSFNGLWFELLWPKLPYWHNSSVPLGFSLVILFASLFSKSFLQTKKNEPVFNKLFSILVIASALSALLSPFISLLYIAPFLSLCGIVLAFTSIGAGISLSIKNKPYAKYYLTAWVFFMIGAFLFSSRNLGWLPSNAFTRHGIIFGSALEMILLSLALAERIKFVRDERDKARQEAFQSDTKLIDLLRDNEKQLANRVVARTQALSLSNEKLREQEEKLTKLAHYDSLTGLVNRVLIAEQLHLLLAQCKRDKTNLAVLFLDLDNFKAINDNHGHQAGDDLLIATADKLHYVLRDSDVIGRLGGDEFIILMTAHEGEFSPQEVAEKIEDAINQPVIINDFSMQVGVSVGIAIYPDDGEDFDTLLSASDKAMYLDKESKN